MNINIKNCFRVATIFVASSFIISSVSSCKGLDNCDGKKNEPKPVEIVMPKDTSEIAPSDMAVLKSLSIQNPDIKLFESKNPKDWKIAKINWEKGVSGKYLIKGITIEDSPELTSDLVINFNANAKSKATRGDAQNMKVVFENLESLVIKTSKIKKFYVENQPKLDSIVVDGMNLSQMDRVDILNNFALKYVKVAEFPKLSDLYIRGAVISKSMKDEYGNPTNIIKEQYIVNKIVLDKLPSLEQLNRICGFYGSYVLTDDEGNGTGVNSMKVNNLVIGGGMDKLYSIKFDYLSVAKLTMNDKSSYPALEIFDMTGQGLVGDLVITNMPKLDHLYLKRNNLSSVSVSNCPKLKELDFFDNPNLKSYSLTNLPALKYLTYYQTNLPKVDFSNLKTLLKIDGHQTNLSDIKLPAATGEANKLEQLNLSDNNLETLDTSAPMVRHIFIITLYRNKFTKFDMSHFSSELETIRLSHNKIKTLILPQDLTTLSGLSEVEIEDNCLDLDVLKKFLGLDLDNYLYAPQNVGKVNKEKHQVDASSYLTAGTITVQKLNGKDWVTAPTGEYSNTNGVYTFNGKGTYRVIITDIADLDSFDLTNPFIVGQLDM